MIALQCQRFALGDQLLARAAELLAPLVGTSDARYVQVWRLFLKMLFPKFIF